MSNTGRSRIQGCVGSGPRRKTLSVDGRARGTHVSWLKRRSISGPPATTGRISGGYSLWLVVSG